MRKLIVTVFLALLLPVLALADIPMILTPGEMGFDYDLNCGQQWIHMSWDSSRDSGSTVLYSEDGRFTGHIDMPYAMLGGKVTVEVENLQQKRLAREIIDLPALSGYTAPKGSCNAMVKDLTLTETPEGFRYAFTAPDTDYMILRYRSTQREAAFPVYPVDESGRYEGEVVCDLTYARSLFTVQVRSENGKLRDEAEVRKGYLAPEAPVPQEGRLSGVVVCIDPGHQENGHFVTEPMGPGLKGKTAGKGGMAQGKVTFRRESIVTLEVGMLLRDELIRQGATVVMTRDAQDIFHTNIERCEIAEAAGADIMLRLHCNSSSKRSKWGIQVYGPLNSDYAKAVASPEEYRRMGEAMSDAMKNAVGYELKESTGVVRLNDSYIGNNWAKMVCFLLEMGYMSNTVEDQKLATPVYQQMLAEGIAEGIYQIAVMRGWGIYGK